MGYTEQNQKAEFFGGACAGMGCIVVFVGVVVFLIVAYFMGGK